MKRINSAAWLPNQNRWQIKVQKDNERRTFTSSKPGRTGQREANAKADAWLDDGISNSNQTINLLWASYMSYLKETKPQTTWRQPDTFGRTWLLPHVGKKRIDKFTDGDFQKILDLAASSGRARKTISDIKNEFNKFFVWCRRNKTSTYTPDDVVVPGNARAGQKDILQPAALRTLFRVSTTSYRGKTIEDDLIHCYRYMVLTGIRPGEMMGLTRSNISEDCRVTAITGAINQFGDHTLGKNENALREIVNCELAAAELKQHQTTQPEIHNDEPFFGEITQSSLRKQWKRYCLANDIPLITPYELRHTFLSYTEKYKAFDINSYVGHSKPIGGYIHNVDGYAEHKSQMINQIFMDIIYPNQNKKSKAKLIKRAK